MRSAVTVQALHEKLLASDSATEVLAQTFGDPVVACRMLCDPLALTPWQRAQLAPTQSEPACHRRVTLLAGGRPVSEADLWYVPARLWPGMAATLAETDRPFGAGCTRTRSASARPRGAADRIGSGTLFAGGFSVKDKRFFFEKKNQKTFARAPPRGAPCITRARRHWQKFLLLFSKRSAFFRPQNAQFQARVKNPG
jgi:hypothetical protein